MEDAVHVHSEEEPVVIDTRDKTAVLIPQAN
jgi:hypothetical protein